MECEGYESDFLYSKKKEKSYDVINGCILL